MATPPKATAVRPLSPSEELAWRALGRAIIVLPRVLEADLLESDGLNLADYSVLMNLSEVAHRTMRMNELANVVALSVSGLTRVVDRLERQGLVERVRAEDDGRGQLAVLTEAGFDRLLRAYPRHLESVRRRVVDHLEGLDLVAFANAVGSIAAGEPGPALRPHANGSPWSADRAIEIVKSRTATVGSSTVRHTLPSRGRRTVGAWCFVDHMGPTTVTPRGGVSIGPHPHMGLQTVTWLLAGELLHRDSLGSEQMIRPGQLNLMTAGHGVTHAEEATDTYRGDFHGVQLWVAQPSETRSGEAAFEHHGELPHLELTRCDATVLVGRLAGATSPARRDTDHVGVDLALHGGETTLPFEPGFEYALVVLDGAVTVEGRNIEPGSLAYLGADRSECGFASVGPSRALLIGGVRFPEPVLMWWNFVARTREEVIAAHDEWTRDTARFGQVASSLDRIEVGAPSWSTKTVISRRN